MNHLQIYGTDHEQRIKLLNETPIGAEIEKLAANEPGLVIGHTKNYTMLALASAERGPESLREVQICLISGGTREERDIYAKTLRPELLRQLTLREQEHAKQRN